MSGHHLISWSIFKSVPSEDPLSRGFHKKRSLILCLGWSIRTSAFFSGANGMKVGNVTSSGLSVVTLVSIVEYFGVLNVTDSVESVSEGRAPVIGINHNCNVVVSVAAVTSEEVSVVTGVENIVVAVVGAEVMVVEIVVDVVV